MISSGKHPSHPVPWEILSTLITVVGVDFISKQALSRHFTHEIRLHSWALPNLEEFLTLLKGCAANRNNLKKSENQFIKCSAVLKEKVTQVAGTCCPVPALILVLS